MNCSCTPLRCAAVSVSVRAGQAAPDRSASCVFNCTSGCHLAFPSHRSIVSPNTSHLLAPSISSAAPRPSATSFSVLRVCLFALSQSTSSFSLSGWLKGGWGDRTRPAVDC